MTGSRAVARGGWSIALRQALILVLLALVPSALSAFLHPKRPDFTDQLRAGEIGVVEAMRKSKNYLWIDARASGERANGQVPHALPLNEDEWDDLLPAVLEAWPTGKPAIVYCDSRQCEASEDVAAR